MRLHQIDRDRARQQLVSSFWKIAAAAFIVGGLFAVTAAGGGFGGPMDGNPADGHKALAVLIVTLVVAALMSLASIVRYLLLRRPTRSLPTASVTDRQLPGSESIGQS